MAGRGEGIEQAGAAQGALGGLVAQHQAIAVHPVQRRIEHQLRQGRGTRGEAVAFQQGDTPGEILGAEVHVHRCPVRQVARLAGQQAQLHVDPGSGRVQRLGHQPVAAGEAVGAQALARQIE